MSKVAETPGKQVASKAKSRSAGLAGKAAMSAAGRILSAPNGVRTLSRAKIEKAVEAVFRDRHKVDA